MTRRSTGWAVAAVTAALLLSSCAGRVDDSYVVENEPSHVEHIEGSDLAVVTVTQRAAERLQIGTEEVVFDDVRGLVVPATAVFVDPHGEWWVYTNPEPLTYVRHAIDIREEAGDMVYLADGPEPGTTIVTIGVAELYGIEDEVGH